MTRSEAIVNISCTWSQRDSEFCVGDHERSASTQELNECLNSLGCTDEEITAAFVEEPKGG